MPNWKTSNFNQYRTYVENFFGGNIQVTPVTDLGLQKKGFDMLITRDDNYYSGTYFGVEEKTRTKYYPDIAFEYETGIYPGWIYQLKTDFLFYHFQQGNRLIIVRPFDLLQAWKRFGETWKWEYGIRECPNYWSNETYITKFVPVPIKTLAKLIYIIGFSPDNPNGKLLTVDNYLFNW